MHTHPKYDSPCCLAVAFILRKVWLAGCVAGSKLVPSSSKLKKRAIPRGREGNRGSDIVLSPNGGKKRSRSQPGSQSRRTAREKGSSADEQTKQTDPSAWLLWCPNPACECQVHVVSCIPTMPNAEKNTHANTRAQSEKSNSRQSHAIREAKLAMCVQHTDPGGGPAEGGKDPFCAEVQ